MKEYKVNKLRNIAIVSHTGAGKTSLVETMLFNAGTIDRLGSVDDGTSVSDHAKDEIDRRSSINCSVCVAERKEHKVNILDTPGSEDFYGDLESALRVADAVIVVVDATTGVEGGTEKVWEAINRHDLPRAIFVNKMDKENASFENSIASVEEILEASIIKLNTPIGKETDFSGVVDLVQMGAFLGPDDRSDIPDDLADFASEEHETVIELAAENDEELIEKYFEEGELTADEIKIGVKIGMSEDQLTPILCGSALQNIGVTKLIDFIIDYFPSPADAKSIVSADGETELTADPDQPLSALVFKTMADPFAGKLTLFRVYSGTLKGDSQIINATKDQNEKIGKVSFMNGKDLIETKHISAGDFGVAIKLANATTNDTFCSADQKIQLPLIDFPTPVMSVAARPAREGDDEKLSTTLQRMVEEDPSFRIERNDVTKQLLISGLGEVHLNVIRNRMKDKFGVETTTEDPKTAYKETIRGSAQNIRGRLKKQTGGRGQFGECWINLEPLNDYTQNYEFVNKITGGSIPRNYIPAVEKGVRERVSRGVLAGFPMVGLKITLYDGKHHPVDSSDLAFQIAGSQALRDAVLQSNPVVLEPIMDVKITVPNDFMGDVIGDLNSKRGRVMGVGQAGRKTIISAQVPLSEMYGYSIDLKSITSARGTFTMEFAHQEILPDDLAKKVIASEQLEKEE